jgi:SAM-dependent methyltransferase
VLDFGEGITARHVECPINTGDFTRFEKRFAPLSRAASLLRRRIPGGKTWPKIIPSREKRLEYYLTLQAFPFASGSTYLDIASCLSLFPNYVAETTEARVYRQDQYYQPGVRSIRLPRFLPYAPSGPFGSPDIETGCIGSDACALPLPDASVDFISLHCSFEHFEGDADTRFAREAFRVLRPGGQVLIIPFYCGDDHQEIVREDSAPGCRFHRFYNVPSFLERVLKPLGEACKIEMRYYTNHKQIDESFYCCYSIGLFKPAIGVSAQKN